MKLAIFDFDGTLLQRDTLPCLGQAWLAQERSKKRYYQTLWRTAPVLIQYKLNILSNPEMRKVILERFMYLFADMTQVDLKRFFSDAYDYMASFFNPEVVKEIEQAKAAGCHTVLLSGTFQELLEVVAERLGIDTFIGAQIKYGADDRIDLNRRIDTVIGQDKHTKLIKYFKEQEIDWENSYSYADSFTDLYILRPVGHPVLVNPDKQLYDWGRQQQCRIIGNKK